MEGLEVAEVRLRDLEKTFRIDSEFFLRDHLKMEARLRDVNAVPISEFANISDGNHLGVSEEFDTKGVPYYRGGDVHGFFIENSSPACYVDKSVYDGAAMQRSHLKKNDVLVTIVGTIGNVAIVSSDAPAMCNCKIAILRPKRELDMAMISTYLASRYGKGQIDRLVRGSVQTGFNLDDFDNFYIPTFGSRVKGVLCEVVDLARNHDFLAKETLEDAESILLSDLGFIDWSPVDGGVSVKPFSEVANACRIDAEYFQPKFDELTHMLSRCKLRDLGGKDGLVDIYKSIDPPSDCYGSEGVPFVRISDFSKFGIEIPDIRVSEEVCSDCRRIKKNAILLTKDGSVGIAYKAECDLEMVTSGAILHLEVKDDSVDPDYLSLVLNSRIVRMQAERDAGGSIIQHWKPSQIEKVQISILPRGVQHALADKVRESFRLRHESKRLLNLAKSAVEKAIEDGEDAALEYIRKIL